MGLDGQRHIPEDLPRGGSCTYCRGRLGGQQVRSGRVCRITIILPKQGSSIGFWEDSVTNMGSVCM